MNFLRELIWLAVAVFAGLALVPAAAYFTGLRLLGPYSEGGLANFFGAFIADLLRMRLHTWTLVLGPILVTVIWRLLNALLGGNRRR